LSSSSSSDLGKYGRSKGVCSICPAGRYQDGKGESVCKLCDVDTFLPGAGKSSNADCEDCPIERSTGLAVGVVDSSACLCRRDLFYTDVNGTCSACPTGADCSAKDGLTLSELFAQPGHWRPSTDSNTFSPCHKGHRGLDAKDLARQRCCPTDKATNTSICSRINVTDDNLDAQCQDGYSGPLCLVCSENFVMMGGRCTSCPGGASFSIAMVPMLGTCVLLFIAVLLYILCGAKRREAMEEANGKVGMADDIVGQLKILLSFLQIFAALPNVLDSVPWPSEFLQVSLPLGIFNLDVLSLLSGTGCELSVRFYDRFMLHMLLPVCCLVAIAAAYFIARLCSKKKQREQINETTSKVVIMVVLLLFPGLSTKIFQMFKCQTIEGIRLPLLVQDYSVTCYQGEHESFVMLAFTFLVIYILGIPLTMFMLLWRNRRHLHDLKSPKHHLIKKALGGLYMQCELF
jgi:cbb3-type cytochrome oxidase subunit 3